jgi:integrase
LTPGLVFTTRHGTPIEPRNFSRSLDRRIAKANVARITPHGARKTCGSLLATLDIHPRVAMQILRHSKIALTMEILHRGPLGRHARYAQEARAVARPVNAAAALCCCIKIKTAGPTIGTGL